MACQSSFSPEGQHRLNSNDEVNVERSGFSYDYKRQAFLKKASQ